MERVLDGQGISVSRVPGSKDPEELQRSRKVENQQEAIHRDLTVSNETMQRVFLVELDKALFINGAWEYVHCMDEENKMEAMSFLKDLSYAAFCRQDSIEMTAESFLNCVKEVVGVN